MNKRIAWAAGALALLASAGYYGYKAARPVELPQEAANAAMAALLEQPSKTGSERGAVNADPRTAPAAVQTELPPSASEVKASPPADPPSAHEKRSNTEPASSKPLLDLNTATLEQLQDLPGIGESKAKSILELRGRLGRFGSVEQLLEVKGIGAKALAKLKPYIRLGGS